MKIKDTLKVRWSKREDDFLISWPDRPCNGHLINHVLFGKRWSFNRDLEPSLIEELESRGYDTKTLKFSVKKKLQLKESK